MSMIDKNLKIETAVEDILTAYGIDLENEHFKETPLRVRKSYDEIFRGLDEDPKKYIKTFNAPKHGSLNQMIIAGPIKCWSLCAHHLLPFSMNIFIGYIPDEKIIGISKFSRIVKHFCAKPQIQEQIGIEVADFLCENLEPMGLGVVIKDSLHTCASMRGAKDTSMSFTTSAIRGNFSQEKIKNEFLDFIK